MTKTTVLLCFVLGFLKTVNSLLCVESFCRNYEYEPGCSPTASHCRINNATHSGISLPSPSMCNCCDYCMPFYLEGERCSLGGPGEGVTVGRCGAGMTCIQEGSDSFCRRIPAEQSKCHADQDDYDDRQNKGLTGALEHRPMCNDKGRYAHVACVPTQTCFCQNEEGDRIFGEVLYEGENTIRNMHCGCSLMNEKIKNLISPGLRKPAIGPRCTSDGNFNPIQCLGRICYCVNRITGLAESDETIQLDEQHYSLLSCYDSSLDIFGQLSPIEAGPPYDYSSACFNDMYDKLDLILQSESEGFITDYYTDIQECLPDGNYGSISLTRNMTKICVDERGLKIEDYAAFPGTAEYQNMDCNCATTSNLMSNSPERPECCHNGNYRHIQCRRGFCRCVDSLGRQKGLESSDVSSLPCYEPNWRSC